MNYVALATAAGPIMKCRRDDAWKSRHQRPEQRCADAVETRVKV